MSKKTKRRSVIRAIVSILVLIAVFAGTLVLLPGDKFIAAGSLLRNINRFLGTGPSVSESFEFEASVDNVFSQINGMLVVGSSTGAACYDAEGEATASVSHVMSCPAISSGAKKAAVWDIGGTNLSIIDTAGEVREITAQGALISVSLNKNDWMAVGSEEIGYNGLVTVYDKSLSPKYKWYSGEGYIVDADISPDSKAMTVTTLTGRGSRIVTFGFDSEVERGSYIAEDQLVFDIEYLSDNRICALSETGLTILNGMMEPEAEYRFNDQYLKDYCLDGDGFAVLFLGKHRAGETGRLVTIGTDGKELGGIDVDGELLSMSAEGRYLAVVYSDKTVVYTADFKIYGELADTTGVKTALMCRDGRVLIISGYGAAVFEP